MQLAPADMSHVWLHALAKRWSPSPHEYALLVAETMAHRVWAAIDEEGTPLAIGGVVSGRCWLSLVPGARRRMLPLVRLMDCARAREQRVGTPRPLCVVRDDNPAGQRLARLLGFAPTERAAGALREWSTHA